MSGYASMTPSKHKDMPHNTSPATKRLVREYKAYTSTATEWHRDEILRLWPVTEDFREWSTLLRGSVGTPYEGGVFRVILHCPAEYPFKPPKLRWCTPIFHCDIDSAGQCNCAFTKGGQWSPAMTIPKLVFGLCEAFGEQNDVDVTNCVAAELHRRDWRGFDQKAREWTQRYAGPRAMNAPDMPWPTL